MLTMFKIQLAKGQIQLLASVNSALFNFLQIRKL